MASSKSLAALKRFSSCDVRTRQLTEYDYPLTKSYHRSATLSLN